MTAEGDLDVRGTLGIAKDAPVRFKQIKLRIFLDAEATPEERARLLQLTERYCVVYQTLCCGSQMSLKIESATEEITYPLADRTQNRKLIADS